MKSSISSEKFLLSIKWFVILQPLLDMITSISVRFISFPLTIGMVFRILFVALIGIYLLVFFKNKTKKYLLGLYIIICIYGGFNIFNNALQFGKMTVLENCKMFFKMYYFIFVLLFFYALFKDYGFYIKNKILTIVFLEYTASIFISAITNTSFVTYNYAKGYCGWFYAGNEVGAIISILSIVSLIYSVNSKNYILKIAVGFLTAFSAVYVGTKVPFLACLGAIVTLLLFFAVKGIIKKDKISTKNCLYLFSFLLITILLFEMNSPVKINNSTMTNEHYETHVTERLENKDKDKEKDIIINDPTINEIYNSKAFIVANWILSDRLISISPAIVSYIKSSALQKCLGMGYIFKTFTGETYDLLIEMDFIALLINHGIVGLILYLIPIFYLAIQCIKKFFSNIKRFFDMEEETAYIYSIIIAIGCAFLAGHVLTAPSVSIYFAIIIVNLYAKLNNYERL